MYYSTSHGQQWRLLAFLFLLLSSLNLVKGAPIVPGVKDIAGVSIKRGNYVPPGFVADPKTGPPISIEEYEAFLKKYYTNFDHYILYSGNSREQVTKFMDKNPGYYYYETFFKAKEGDGKPFTKEFYDAATNTWRGDDGDASSKAIAETIRDKVLVFGAAEYQTKGDGSFFKSKEVESLHAAIKAGRIKGIYHMVKDATSPSQVLAVEDGDGHFTWTNGKPEPNASVLQSSSSASDSHATDGDDTALTHEQSSGGDPKASGAAVNADGTITKPYGDPAAHSSQGGDASAAHGQSNANSNFHPGSDSTTESSHGSGHGTTIGEGGLHL